MARSECSSIDEIIKDLEASEVSDSRTLGSSSTEIPLLEVTVKMVDDVCTELTDKCLSSDARSFFRTVSRSDVLEATSFMNRSLVPRSKFVTDCRERVCANYHRLYLANMQSVTRLTGSPKTSAWLCLQILKVLLEKNYPLSTTKKQTMEMSRDITSEIKDIIIYIGGSIIAKLRQRYTRLHADTIRDEKLSCLREFEAGKENLQPASVSLTATLDRGALVYLKEAGVHFFLVLETKVSATCEKNETAQCKLDDFRMKCLCDETVTSSFHSVVYSIETTIQTKESVFADIVQLYFKIRIHHECKMFLEKLKNKKSTNKKGLRKSLKE